MKEQMTALVLLLLLGGMPASAANSGGQKEIDSEKSVITVRVYKSGLFSAFAHNHEIRAPIQKGSFDEEKNSVEFSVDARTLRVLDPEASEKDRAEIQSTMLGPKVLDSERFPEIRFRSTGVEKLGEGKWRVQGELTLHGQTHPVSVEVQGGKGRYQGSAQLLQRTFAITPVSIAGGSVKVKDEVRIEFTVAGK